MGWREELYHVVSSNIERDYHDGGSIVDHDAIAVDLITMPDPDRIALARELLEGTGRVVVRGEQAGCPHYTAGCARSANPMGAKARDTHAAMLAEDGDGG